MLKYIADSLVYRLMGIQPGTRLAEALDFFFYDTMKVFLLLVVIIFGVAIIRSFFPPEKSRKLLGNRKQYVGNLLAALLGIVTPFCSCSAIPMFIGFLESGLPLGVTFSFLISSPTVNEVALIMLWGLFGWRIALLYTATGVIIAFFAGIAIGKLKLEHLVEDYVYRIRMGETEIVVPTWGERLAVRAGLHDGHPRAHLAVHPHRHRVRRPDPRLCAYRFRRPIRRARQPLRRAYRGPHRHPPLFERGGNNTHRPGPGRERAAHGHGPRLHDVHRRHIDAGDDHPSQGHQAQADRHLCGHSSRGDYHRGIPV